MTTAGGGPEESQVVARRLPFRQANEQIRLAVAAFVAHDPCAPVEFVCECADERCFRVVRLTVAEYAAARSDPRYYVVLPGHEEATDTATVRCDRFAFVRDGEPGDIRD